MAGQFLVVFSNTLSYSSLVWAQNSPRLNSRSIRIVVVENASKASEFFELFESRHLASSHVNGCLTIEECLKQTLIKTILGSFYLTFLMFFNRQLSFKIEMNELAKSEAFFEVFWDLVFLKFY